MGRFAEDITYPPSNDLDAWRAFVARGEELMGPVVARADGFGATVTERDIAGVCVFVIRPQGTEATDPRRYLDIHGGGLTGGAGPLRKAMGIIAAQRMQAKTWLSTTACHLIIRIRRRWMTASPCIE